MTAQRFEAAPATFNTTIHFQQLEGFDIQPGQQMARVRPAGQVDGLAHILASANPRVNFSTRDLLSFFTSVSPSVGLAITNATFRLKQRNECGLFTTGATGMTITATKGCLYPTSLQADQDSAEGARVDAAFAALYDGSNKPLVINDTVDLDAAPAAAFSSLYFLGPVYINAVEIPGVTSVNVDFGLNFTSTPTTPGPYHHTGAYVNRDPTISFTTRKLNEMDGIGNLFANAAAGAIAIYLQAGAASSDRQLAASSVHVKISATAGEIHPQNSNNQAGQDGLVNYMVKPTSALAVSVASAIGA